DPEDFLRDFQRYVVASRINIAPGAGQVTGRAEALGLLISCLEGPAKQWYETNIKGKNWKCSNISDNLGVATLTAVRALAAGNGGGQVGALNTAGEFQGKAAAKIGRIGAAPNITLGQLIYLLNTAYTTVEHLKQTTVFGQLMQEQQREQFIRSLNPMNQYNIRMMAKFYDTQDNITKALAEAEKFTLSQKSVPSSLPIFPTANPYADTNRSG
ncbi:16111_t:CDS:2, partial [Rhizophagus irregularis]